MHIHLDPLGGMAGDMFIAAILDARPDLESQLTAAVRACGLPEGWSVLHARRRTKSIDARTFDVVAPAGPTRSSGRFATLMQRIDAMPLAAGVKARATAIYTLLGECEAVVHGIALDDVHFHELADWDSLVDIVGAATLIEALGADSFSASAIPLGSGLVNTEHGPLPVPAPATARLIEGMVVHQDGIAGERVTPTGAAILRHMQVSGDGMQPRRTRALGAGLGAGMRELDGCANVLRVQMLQQLDTTDNESAASARASDFQPSTDVLSVFEFEIDDQTPEELATALQCLRETAGVVDVFSYSGIGKKQRMMMAVRLLCQPANAETVAAACFAHTTTLGLRRSDATRVVLKRESVTVETAAGAMPVKVAQRPGGSSTAKVEHDAVVERTDSQSARRRLAADAESLALRDLPRAARTGEPTDD